MSQLLDNINDLQITDMNDETLREFEERLERLVAIRSHESMSICVDCGFQYLAMSERTGHTCPKCGGDVV